MHIANKRRFFAFVTVVALLLAAGGLSLWHFRAVPLMDVIGASVDVEQLARVELTSVLEGNQSASVTLTDPTDIRACLAPLIDARVKPRLFAERVRIVTPGTSFLVRFTDLNGREAVFDVAGRSIVVNLNRNYSLVEPESLSALEAVRADVAARDAA